MRVLVLSHMYPNNMNPIYGIYVHDQVLALKEQGCDVRVVSPVSTAPFPLPVFNRRWKNYSRVKRHGKLDGVEIIHPRVINLPGGAMLDWIGQLWFYSLLQPVYRIYRDFKFDIIHSHVALPDGYAGVLLARKFSIPVVTFIHGTDLQATIHRGEKCRESLRWVLANSSKVITVSNKLRKIGVGLLGDESKFVTIHNGINLNKIYRGISPLGSKYYGKKVLLSVGNLKKTKGFDLTIQALARLKSNYPEACLLIIGSGPEEYKLRELSVELGIADKVEFLGPQPHEKVMEYMSLADIFVLPSWEEGFGVVYVEAMANGVPVIGCRGQGIADVIEDGQNGMLVAPRNSDALTAALEKLLQDERLVRNIGAQGQETVNTSLTWDHIAKQVIAQCRELTL